MTHLRWIVRAAVAALLSLSALAAAAADAAATYQQGMKAAASQDYAAALDQLEAALVAEPDNLRWGTDYRQVVIAAEAYDRCLAFFEKLVADHPRAANAWLNYGYAYVDKIPVEGAITQVILANTALTQFSKAIEVAPSWLALYTRGNSYLFWPAIFGRTPLGIADLQRAIELARPAERQPYHGHAWAALGDAYWRLEDLAQANNTWREGLEKYPEHAGLQERVKRQGAELDLYLEEHFDTHRRVATDLREIWAVEAGR